MATEFKMPQLGLTMTEGTISKWLKRAGDTVAIGDPLVEVETDKITNQLESTIAGTVLEILAPEGTVAAVQTPIVVIGMAGEKATTSAVNPTGVTAVTPETCSETHVQAENVIRGADERLKASPLAKKMAKEQGIDLAVVTGTGPGGRVVERDIVGYFERNTVKATPFAVKIANELGIDLSTIIKDSRIMKDDVLAAAPSRGNSAPQPDPASGVPITGMRKVIAERMSISWQTAPHVNMTSEVDMSAAGALKSCLTAAAGKKISFTEIIIKCAAQALTEYRDVNASLISGNIFFHESVSIGVAVALDNGLIVPVIKDAAKKSVVVLRDEISALSQKAREGTLSQAEISGGTFTVTNLGMFGVDHFTPIINQPESAILGVCRVLERAVVRDGSVVIRPMMNLCLSFDHRLIDGAVGARFLARVRQLLEQPLLLI